MRLTSLSLRDFRNASTVELQPSPRFNVIVGDNGQGKTNLVEAVHLLATLKSFRGAKNAHLIREGQEEAFCRAWIESGPHRREAELRIRPRSKRVSLNGEVVRKLAGFFGTLNAVTFVPEDVQVMKGSPSDRRLLLDRMVFHAILPSPKTPRASRRPSSSETRCSSRSARMRASSAFTTSSSRPRRRRVDASEGDA